MSLRYTMTPQMRQYDGIGQVWVPYLMHFHTPNYTSETLNTDSRGFRIVHKDNKRIADFDNPCDLPVSIVVGGSSAFGIGATGDGMTVPSYLNALTDEMWLNFGGRAFSSTQELLLFMFNRHYINRVKRVVILSGINNLTIHYLSNKYRREHGSFFFFEKFDQAMNSPNRSSLKGKIMATLRKPESRDSTPLKREDLLYVLHRDIGNWRLLSKNVGFELNYILQPTFAWLRKQASEEEERLFQELDSYPQNQWKVLKDKLNQEQYEWFLTNLREICNNHNVPFFDMNKGLSSKQIDKKWLFVDRIHSTDEGYKLMAEIIKNEVIS